MAATHPMLKRFGLHQAGVLALALTASPAPAQEALSVDPSGNVGIGIAAPAFPLHVVRDNGGSLLQLLQLENNGDPSFVLRDSSSGNATEFRLLGPSDTFSVNHVGTGGAEFRITRAGQMIVGPAGAQSLVLAPNGNLTIAGTLQQNSDVNAKRAVELVEAETVLAKIASLPISTWEYKSDEDGVKHLGPMAQDFHSAFGLGDDPSKLSPGDVAGAAIAAIQAQQAMIIAQGARIEALEAQLRSLDALKGEIAELRGQRGQQIAFQD